MTFTANLLFLLKPMFKIMRKVVAGPKRTTNYDGNQLDLTYISERIIAMAFPASDMLEKTYRNNIEDVSNYFSEYHKDNYLVFNVSSRNYDYQQFDKRVKDFEWVDHQAPTLPVLVKVAYEMYSFLREDKARVVAVHCNHGKGRTGTAIIAFFLLIGYSQSASSCLKFYNCKRFNKDTYGVDQPCQLRYLEFMEKLMEAPVIKKKLPCFHLKQVSHKGLNENYYVRIKSTKTQETIYEKVNVNQQIPQSPSKFLMADIFIELLMENWMGQRRVSRINYNLYFLQNNLKLTFKGSNIKLQNNHAKDFELTLEFQYHCLCHLPEYNETICTCNYVRNIEQLQWERMIAEIKQCKKLNDDDREILVHGFKPVPIEEEDEGRQAYVIKQEQLEPQKAIKNFRNSRQEKLYVLSQNKKLQNQYIANEATRSSKDQDDHYNQEVCFLHYS